MYNSPLFDFPPCWKLLHVLHKRTVLAKIPIRKTTHKQPPRRRRLLLRCSRKRKSYHYANDRSVQKNRPTWGQPNYGWGYSEGKKKERNGSFAIEMEKKQKKFYLNFHFHFNWIFDQDRARAHTLTHYAGKLFSLETESKVVVWGRGKLNCLSILLGHNTLLLVSIPAMNWFQ